jgi:amino acid transporter
MSLIDTILGRPLASNEAGEQRIGPAAGVPTFGLDALSSAAYGPEAALTVLLPLGAAGLTLILPITIAIVILLGIVYVSYLQTIAAYPNGGGSYTVARENLGTNASLLAAAALMTDYVLNVAVGISAGIGALISAVPVLQPYTLTLCLLILVLLTLVNLRGIGEAGTLFMLPTSAFILSLSALVLWGLIATISAGVHPHPVVPPAHLAHATEAVGAWLLLRAFTSGCTAMTGVEAVSNGVQAFREPVVPAARRTLSIILVILMLLLLGIAYLAHAYHVGATEPGTSQYQSVLSQLIGAVAGRGIFYWVSIASILPVLCLSANTSFADFPRLCRAVAEDGYLPRSFTSQGRRLVYSEGIWVLAFLSGVLLIVFDGITDRLIPLFAVGAFLAFTLSQSGMVAHWWKHQERGADVSMAVNGLGATATAASRRTPISCPDPTQSAPHAPLQKWDRRVERVRLRALPDRNSVPRRPASQYGRTSDRERSAGSPQTTRTDRFLSHVRTLFQRSHYAARRMSIGDVDSHCSVALVNRTRPRRRTDEVQSVQTDVPVMPILM